MKKLTFLAFVAGMLLQVTANANPASDMQYLPKGEYDEAIPKPADILGYPVGTWHVRHDQLVNYMYAVAEASDRVSIEEIGRTHEHRPLLHLTFSSPENMGNMDAIKAKHMAAWRGETKQDENAPVVLWMGYSIHGNEPSGSNAALLVAYYLAAAKSEKVQNLLSNTVIVLDPSFNPDGLSRFAQWANMHKGYNLVSDPDHREHREEWPNGRTNHYWFDLNRDWLLLTHPESQARIWQFHQWRPHILTDFHEMGTNSTYFFQPGIPSRTNPNTPQTNIDLTNALAKFHAKALDEKREFYFTQESFDDFYYGKGSTYPDAHGTIGILFEQASSRGHLQDSVHGQLSFPQTIQNQFTTSLSTFEGALATREELIAYQNSFPEMTAEEAEKDETAGYVVAKGEDTALYNQFLEILQQHQIEVQALIGDFTVDEEDYYAGQAVYVSLRQPQYRLVKSMFSKQKRFKDNTFYDVSNWNIALAFNLKHTAVPDRRARKLPIDSTQLAQRTSVSSGTVDNNAVAYLFEWKSANAPGLLQALLEQKIKAYISEKPFSAVTADGNWSFASGTVMVRNDDEQPIGFLDKLTALAAGHNIKLWSATGGLTPQGIDLGSRHMAAVAKPRILLVGGMGVNPYEAGEVWHYLDNFVGVSPTLVNRSRMGSLDLSNYSHMIFVDGNYGNFSESVTKKIGEWLTSGGVLIGQKRAGKWFSDKEWLKASYADRKDIDDAFDTSTYNFDDREALAGKKRIAGAVFSSEVDHSHPMLYGFADGILPTFKNHNLIMQVPKKPFITPAKYTARPLLAGYASDEVEKLVSNSAAIVAHRVGSGRVIVFADNPNFRGYWRSTRRLLTNAIFMAPFIDEAG